jgi:hypothetical protein
MRLIDANALIEVVKTARKRAKTLTGMDFVMSIEKQPTVQAITMDWLDEQIHGYASRLQSTELKALLIVKGLWEKDQEAKS